MAVSSNLRYFTFSRTTVVQNNHQLLPYLNIEKYLEKFHCFYPINIAQEYPSIVETIISSVAANSLSIKQLFFLIEHLCHLLSCIYSSVSRSSSETSLLQMTFSWIELLDSPVPYIRLISLLCSVCYKVNEDKPCLKTSLEELESVYNVKPIQSVFRFYNYEVLSSYCVVIALQHIKAGIRLLFIMEDRL